MPIPSGLVEKNGSKTRSRSVLIDSGSGVLNGYGYVIVAGLLGADGEHPRACSTEAMEFHGVRNQIE